IFIMLLLAACGRKLPEEGAIIADAATSLPPTATIASAEADSPDEELTAVVPTEATGTDTDSMDDTAAEGTEEIAPTEAADATADKTDTDADTGPAAPAPIQAADNVVTMVNLADAANGETLFNRMTDTGFA